VEEIENSLVIRVNYTSLGDAKEPAPGTQRGFRGREYRGQGFRSRGSRGRIAVADGRSRQQEDLVNGPGTFSDRRLDFNSSSSGATSKSQVEEEQVGRGRPRARGRWHGPGWRRGGAGRYFRQRSGERPVMTFDQRPDDKNLALSHGDSSSPKISDTSFAATQDSNSLSANTAGEQGARSTDTENVASVNNEHRNMSGNVNSVRSRPIRSANRRAVNRQYIVRRSSADRRRHAGPGEARVAAASQQVAKTDDSTNREPYGHSDVRVTEDWDAECASVEPTNTEMQGSKTDTVDTHAASNSSGVSEELGAHVDPVNNSSS